jgi:hypothetical protein
MVGNRFDTQWLDAPVQPAGAGNELELCRELNEPKQGLGRMRGHITRRICHEMSSL